MADMGVEDTLVGMERDMEETGEVAAGFCLH
jgi:hypothetical protein